MLRGPWRGRKKTFGKRKTVTHSDQQRTNNNTYVKERGRFVRLEKRGRKLKNHGPHELGGATSISPLKAG